MPRSRPRFQRPSAVWLIASFALIIGGFAAACDDDGSPPPAPGAAPTATPASADPETAARLRYEGETEAAIEVYAAVAVERDGADRQAARLALAQLHYEADRPLETIAAADAYLSDASADGAASPAAFLRATALAESGDAAGALAAYDAYLAPGAGTLAPFVRAERALILAKLGRTGEASAAAEAVAAVDLPMVEDGFLFDVGAAFESAGATTEALDWYGRAIATYNSPGGLDRRAAILRERGDPAWIGASASIIATAPSSLYAIAALEALDAAAVPVSTFQRAYVLYRAFRNDEARAAFEQAISEDDAAASATYYLGALDERAGDNSAAVERYAAAYTLDPNTSTADDALWWRGKLLEGAGSHSEAASVFATLAADYPSSEFAADAAFHRALALYRDGDEPGAASAWEAVAAAASGHDRARALFWQGRADSSRRDELYAALAAEFPDDFYALRAEVLLGTNDRNDDAADLDRPVDWDIIDIFVAQLAPSDPLMTPTPVGAPDIIDERLALAQQLDEAGRGGRADRLYAEVIADHQSEPYALFRIARAAEFEHRIGVSARAATLLVASLPDTPPPPADLFRAAYPPAYSDLVLDAAKEQRIDPLLLMALMRQESLYDPRAGSSAGALGLTQVIEPTGQAIARDLGITDFALTDLYRPRLSLRFGASYLADQIDAFDGNLYFAIAAYNGGPGASQKAIEASAGDIDLFAEDLEFEETRRYVRLVMEHYARYRQAYLELDRPSLPK